MPGHGRQERIATRHAAQGFTLVELMIAMVLGLLIIAGVVSVLLSNLHSYHATEALSEVQTNARLAFELMARDIRQAGLTGCNSRNGRITNVLNNGPHGAKTTAWWADFGNSTHAGDAVRGYDGNQADPATNRGTAVNQRVTGTDSLMTIGASGESIAITASDANAGSIDLHRVGSLRAGDVVMACDPDHTAIFSISSLTGNKITYQKSSGATGNCSTSLGYPTSCSTGNNYTFQQNALISPLQAQDWYIGNNAAGGRSLYRKVLRNINGTPTPTAQEIVRNVTDMQITYHQSGDKVFVDAASVASWNRVDGVHITLTVQSANQHAGTDAKPLERTVTSTTSIRNRLN